MAAGRPWFAPKAFGLGASLPIRWQGWALLAAFGILMALDVRYLRGLLRAAATAVLVVGFGALCALKTEGGWRWRWNGRDV